MKTKNSSPATKQTSRRQFAKSVATTLIAAPFAASLAKAQNTSKPKEPTAPPNPQQTPAPQKPSPLAEAYAEVAHTRFGDKMTPEQFEKVKRDLEGSVRTADRLRAVKLKNGDEPDFIFSAG